MTRSLTANPPTLSTEHQRVRRARLMLTGLASIAALLIAAVVVLAVVATERDTTTATAAPTTPALAHPADGWDWAGEAALASRPMPLLAPLAAQPQTLAAIPNPQVLTLPAPRIAAGPLAYGLPGTPEGAIAALAALDETGLRGGDPQTYATSYRSATTPAAPAAEHSRLFGLLTDMRASAGLPATGSIDGLSITYHVMQAQTKGLRDGGRYAVVCVLGELAIDYHGRLQAFGVSDCQAMRYLPTTEGGGQWRVSPGPAAARGADAWPGSNDSFRTGYLEVKR